MLYCKEIRNQFIEKFKRNDFVTNATGSLSGSKTIEILGASFIADEDCIFGSLNNEYVNAEIQWYLSESLNVNDIPGGPPSIWKAVSSKNGEINSNYGHLIFSEKNHLQFTQVVNSLIKSPSTRHGVMIYTRPSIHKEFNRDGMTDFICTNAVHYLIRDGKLNVVVQMRSNDCWAGYRNDLAWNKYVQTRVIDAINDRTKMNLECGQIHWQVSSLHLYEKQFYLIENYIRENESN